MSVPPPPTARIAAIDAARGLAIAAMVLYHVCWDVTYFGLARFDLFGDALWLAARDTVLGLFLVLVGAGLTLATREGVRWRRFASRLAVVGGAALAVTAASLWFAPEAVIFFGALHHIALASLLGLAFIRLPGWTVLAAAAACLAAPELLAGPVFDRDWLSWLGLMSHTPRSFDYVPLLPWFGLVLAGIALGRRLAVPWLAGWRPAAAPWRVLIWAGRRSLAIYLVHQPLLLGALWLAVAATGAGVAGGTFKEPASPERFQPECRAACEKTGGTGGQCLAYCRCVDAQLAEAGLWPAFLENRLDPAGQRRLATVIRSCAANRTEP